jgi:intracellular multiplication protein IcmV
MMAEAKKKKGFVRGVYHTFLDVPSWVGYRQIKKDHKAIFSNVKEVFVADKGTFNESFEEAMLRLNLTEKDIKARCKENKRLVYIYASLGLACLLYTLYLLWGGGFSASLLALAVSGFALAKAYQYSFWHFQMKNRKLGCSFNEWLSGEVSTEG